jgi:hypothetical protein
MLTPATLNVLEATLCPSVGGQFPKLIAQFFQALDYTPIAISGGNMQGRMWHRNNNNKNCHSLEKLKVQDQKT